MASGVKLGLIFLIFATTVFAEGLTKLNNLPNFCCEIELDDVNIDVVKMKPVKKTKYEEKEVLMGYEKCGILRKKVCPIYDNIWNQISYYAMEQVVEKQTYPELCPRKHLVCCEGYQKFHDNCYKPDVIECMKKLEELGIIGFTDSTSDL